MHFIQTHFSQICCVIFLVAVLALTVFFTVWGIKSFIRSRKNTQKKREFEAKLVNESIEVDSDSLDINDPTRINEALKRSAAILEVSDNVKKASVNSLGAMDNLIEKEGMELELTKIRFQKKIIDPEDKYRTIHWPEKIWKAIWLLKPENSWWSKRGRLVVIIVCAIIAVLLKKTGVIQ